MKEIDEIADAILYEGYSLFPYRSDALKNQKRFNFGIVAPRIYAENRQHETFFQHSECLISSFEETFEISLKVRFLQIEKSGDRWQTARKREFEKSFVSSEKSEIENVFDFGFEGEKDFCPIKGQIKISLHNIEKKLYKLKTILQNLSDAEFNESDDVQSFSFLSTHTIFRVRGGAFISLLEPPEEFEFFVKDCENTGVFPVLAGDERERNCVLASPIILYDFPKISDKSFAEFFDGTEIDELMFLSILALTDEEKKAAKSADEKTRRMIEKIETASAADLLKLHAEMTNG